MVRRRRLAARRWSCLEAPSISITLIGYGEANVRKLSLLTGFLQLEGLFPDTGRAFGVGHQVSHPRVIRVDVSLG